MIKIVDKEIKPLIKNHIARAKKKISIGDSLFLVFTKAGTPTWEYVYRFDGKQRTLSIGIYPEVGLRQARVELHQARLKVSEGIDPSRQKQINKFSKKQKNSFTFWHKIKRNYCSTSVGFWIEKINRSLPLPRFFRCNFNEESSFVFLACVPPQGIT